ncbi:MAG TPA: hypothetical protein VIN59_09095 [Alphaproteobacteria bacterium]
MVWILLPQLRDRTGSKSAMLTAFVLAILAVGLYLLAGAPQLPSAPDLKSTAEIENEMRGDEAEIRIALAKNPNDAEAMIRLAALYVYRGKIDQETKDLLNRAEKQLPGDKRIQYVRYYIENEAVKP